MLEKYGEESVLVTRREEDGIVGKVRDVDDPKVYMHNSEILLKRHPEIRDAFQTERLEPYVRKTHGFSQFFLGRKVISHAKKAAKVKREKYGAKCGPMSIWRIENFSQFGDTNPSQYGEF